MADNKRTCSIPECEKPHHSRGLCGMHAQRLKRNGDPLSPGSRIHGDDLARFWSYVKKSDDGCWNWTGDKSRDGYGLLRIKGVNVYMPRYSFEMHVGPIDSSHEPDHLCRNRACVNPEHLEPVTHKENILRGESPQAINARKTHCPQGHEYSPENTRIQRRGGRLCRKCQSKYSTERRRRKRQAV